MPAAAARTKVPSTAQPARATVEWNETVAMARHRMRAACCDALSVVQGAEAVGTVTLQDIERCERQGNWLDSVLVVDIIRRSGSNSH